MTTFEGMTEEDQLNTLMAELKDSNIRQSVMEYIANKSESAPGMTDKQRLSKMIETIAAESVTNQKQSALWKSRTKKSILLGIVAVMVAITVQFLVNFFSNELSKESHVTGKGTMVGTDGSVVKTQMDEMRVNAEGQLQGRSSVKTIKTTPSLNKIALASSLPDTTLMALDEVTVYSDKGHTLRIKVHGFARVPVLNSRCGNLVHFYTAWNGRISLDSTDLSFDKDTESHFKAAGFSLAVGGFGGRRLAGGSRSMAFFKHVDKMKKSGAWTCADVPLPASADTFMSRENTYRVCKEHDCYSDYGGLKLGVAKIAEAHALAAMPITSRMRALLKGSTTEVFYVKSESTNIVSPSYSVEIMTLPNHFGQEKISILDRETDKTVVFQVVMGDLNTIAHCEASTDEEMKQTKKFEQDKEVDSEVHMEFLGLVQEGDKVLRQWRWWYSRSLMKARGGGDGTYAGEYWDFADTLMPYRSLGPTGSVYITDSFTSKCTDADVMAALSLRSSVPIKDLLECRAEKADEEMVPKMEHGIEDLGEQEISYYTWQVFGDIDAAQKVAAAGEEDDTLTQVADYLIRGEKGWSEGSVSDPCYLACKELMDWSDSSEDDCENGAHAAVSECLWNSHAECRKMPLTSVERDECTTSQNGDGNAGQNRALEEEVGETEEMADILVPEGKDGVVNLLRASPTFQAALSKNLGGEMPKITVNATRKLNANRRLSKHGTGGKTGMNNCVYTKYDPKRPRTRTNMLRLMTPAEVVSCRWGDGDPYECPEKPKTGKISPDKAKKTEKEGGGTCATCTWPLCVFTGIWNAGSTSSIWDIACLSFSICVMLKGLAVNISLQLKFAPVAGWFTFSIILEACVDDFQIVMGIPKPWFMSVCVGGQMHVTECRKCPDLGLLNMSGGGYLCKSVAFYFYIYPFGIKVGFSIDLVSLTVGVNFGTKWVEHKVTATCWRTDGNRRRRREGKGQKSDGRRRRSKWKCHWKKVQRCDQYTKWYVTLKVLGKLKFGFECWEYKKGKKKEGFLFFQIDLPTGVNLHGLQWKWEEMGRFCCFKKYNGKAATEILPSFKKLDEWRDKRSHR